MKKYILISQGFPIYETIDKEEAIEYMEEQNKEHYKWIEECINNNEPYDSTQEIYMLEEEATEEDILRLYRDQSKIIKRYHIDGYRQTINYLEIVITELKEKETTNHKDTIKYINELIEYLQKELDKIEEK